MILPAFFLVLLVGQDDTVVKRLSTGVVLRVPKAWKESKPRSKMRLVQYALADKDKKGGDAELVLYYFGRGGGGGIEANIDRWVAQFQGAARKDAKIEKGKTASGLATVHVDLAGTYLPPNFGGEGKSAPRKNSRMVAIILRTPVGDHFFKLLGPAETVNGWAKVFLQCVRDAKFVEEE